MRDNIGKNVLHWLAFRLRGIDAVLEVVAVIGPLPEEVLLHKDHKGNTALHCVARPGHTGLQDFSMETVAAGKAASATALMAIFLLENAPRAQSIVNNRWRTPAMELLRCGDIIAAGVVLSRSNLDSLSEDVNLLVNRLFSLQPSFTEAYLLQLDGRWLLTLLIDCWRPVRPRVGMPPCIVDKVMSSLNDSDLCNEQRCSKLLGFLLTMCRLDMVATLLRKSHAQLRFRLYSEVLALLTRPRRLRLACSGTIESMIEIVQSAPHEVFSDGTFALRACQCDSSEFFRAILRRSPPSGPFHGLLRRQKRLSPDFCSPRNYIILFEELPDEVLSEVPVLFLLRMHPHLTPEIWQAAIDSLPYEALLLKCGATGATAAHICVSMRATGRAGALFLSALFHSAPELRHITNKNGHTPIEHARNVLLLEEGTPLFQVLQGMTKSASTTN